MISFSEITVVVQGNIRCNTAQCIESIRKHLPGATVILSTFLQEPIDSLPDAGDILIRSIDPGALPNYTRSRYATENNLNRQIVSTQAGLVHVTTPYVLKLRSDADIKSSSFVDVFQHFRVIDPTPRLLACSYFTRHPKALSSYLFHVSDWAMFGPVSKVRDFWSVPIMERDEATWFDAHQHAPNSTAAARRFRARYTPEQYLTINFARRHGYNVPAFLNEHTPSLVTSYQAFLGKEVVVADPEQLGISLTKYAYLAKSLYQSIDCLSYHDWLECFTKHHPLDSQMILPSKRSWRERAVTFGLRMLAHRFRNKVISLALFRNKLRSQNSG